MSDNTLSALIGNQKKKSFSIGDASDKIPVKPDWVIASEKTSGIEYEWDPMRKGWRPKQDTQISGGSN
jgi:hypothetical protein